MPYIYKTKDRLDTIPPQLCTAEEAIQILGLKDATSLKNYIRKGLHAAYVIYQKKRRFVFIRKEVESYRHPQPPANTISTPDLVKHVRKVCKIKLRNSQIVYHLKHNHGLQPQKVDAPHPYLAWPIAAAIPAAIAAAQSIKQQKAIKKQNKLKRLKTKTQKTGNIFA